MKLKKFIATVVALTSFASISAVSYAASLVETANAYKFETKVYATDGSDTIEAGENITVEVYIDPVDGQEVDFAKNANSEVIATFILPADVVDIDASTDFFAGDEGITAIGLTDRNEEITVSVDAASNVCSVMFSDNFNRVAGTIVPDEPVFTMTFNTKSTAPAGNYSAALNYLGCSMADAETNATYKSAAADMTSGSFVIAGGDDDTISATKAEAANGANTNTYTFENSDAMAGKKVIMQNAKMSTTGMTADTRFIVSDGTRTQIFGSDIWAKLGAEGDGVIDVANVIFGIIVDAANTSTFTFTVE